METQQQNDANKMHQVATKVGKGINRSLFNQEDIDFVLKQRGKTNEKFEDFIKSLVGQHLAKKLAELQLKVEKMEKEVAAAKRVSEKVLAALKDVERDIIPESLQEEVFNRELGIAEKAQAAAPSFPAKF